MSDYGTERRGTGRGPVWIGLVVVVVAVALIAAAFLGSRGSTALRSGSGAGVASLKVVASVPPLTWPVRELEPSAEITVLSPVGSSPHGMELTPSQLRAIADADVVLLVGLGLDDAVRRAVDANPHAGRQVVVLEDSLEMAGVQPLVEGGEGESSGDRQGAATTKIMDPHAWLDPVVMRVFVGRVDVALARATGGNVSGAPILQQRCDSINRTYHIALSTLAQRDMVCQHNAYGYLAARYHLEVVAVIQPVESGEVSPGDLKRVVDAIHEHRIGAIFVEPGTPSPAAQRVAEETGVRVLTLDPLDDGDWPKLMNDNLEVLLEGLSARAPARPSAANGSGGDAS